MSLECLLANLKFIRIHSTSHGSFTSLHVFRFPNFFNQSTSTIIPNLRQGFWSFNGGKVEHWRNVGICIIFNEL